MPPTPISFVSRKGALSGYEVTGWRYVGDAAWHVRAGRQSRQWDAKNYVVRDGALHPGTALAKEKTVILTLVAQWEAGLPPNVTDFLDFINPD